MTTADHGVKHDANKHRPSLILHSMSRAIIAVSEAGTFGAQKYGEDNWLDVPNGLQRYRDAKMRHMLASATEDEDQDSGLLHAAHEAWNALAVLELILRERQNGQSINYELYTKSDEQRMDVVGTNGNDGEHYASLCHACRCHGAGSRSDKGAAK